MEEFIEKYSWLRWVLAIAIVAAIFTLEYKYSFLEPVTYRRAIRELTLAGYENVSVHRVATVAEIWRCRDQYELKMRVDTFVWESRT